VLVAWRSRRATLIRLLAPFVFLVLALIINLALEADNAQQERLKDAPGAVDFPVAALPSCNEDLYIGPGRECVDFVYTPAGNPQVDAVIRGVMANNAPPIPENRVRGFPNRTASDAWMLANGDAALGGVHFSRDARGALQYVLQSNSTVKYFKGKFQDPTTFFQLPLMSAVARELARAAVLDLNGGANATTTAAPPFKWAPRVAAFPHPNIQGASLLGGVLAAFLFAALMFGFVTQMANLVSEREAGLRTALANVGMTDAAYWASWAAFDALMALATALLIVVFGAFVFVWGGGRAVIDYGG
jgi:hypothetical protein